MKFLSPRWIVFGLAVIGFIGDQTSKYGMFRWLETAGERIHVRDFPDQRPDPFGKDVWPGFFMFSVEFDPHHQPNCDCFLTKLNSQQTPRVNHGALFSLGGEHKQNANLFFATISLLAALGITLWALTRRVYQADIRLVIALGLILGGTLGNFYDRLLFGGVRDFLYFYKIDWPVFNIADCCLVCGAGFLLLEALFPRKKEESTSAPTPLPNGTTPSANPS